MPMIRLEASFWRHCCRDGSMWEKERERSCLVIFRSTIIIPIGIVVAHGKNLSLRSHSDKNRPMLMNERIKRDDLASWLWTSLTSSSICFFFRWTNTLNIKWNVQNAKSAELRLARREHVVWKLDYELLLLLALFAVSIFFFVDLMNYEVEHIFSDFLLNLLWVFER